LAGVAASPQAGQVAPLVIGCEHFGQATIAVASSACSRRLAQTQVNGWPSDREFAHHTPLDRAVQCAGLLGCYDGLPAADFDIQPAGA
jgi:hypothetical protein